MYFKKRQENFESRILEASKIAHFIKKDPSSTLHKFFLHIIEFFLPIFNIAQRKIARYKIFLLNIFKTRKKSLLAKYTLFG